MPEQPKKYIPKRNFGPSNESRIDVLYRAIDHETTRKINSDLVRLSQHYSDLLFLIDGRQFRHFDNCASMRIFLRPLMRLHCPDFFQ